MQVVTNKMYIFVTAFAIINIKQSYVTCSNITDAENLHTALLTGYNKDVRPITNQREILNVTVMSFVRSVQNLDELTGELSFTGAIQLTWTDDKMSWTPSDYGYTYYAHISYESVWAPELVITTTTDKADTLSKKWQKVSYKYTGFATHLRGERILASCNLDVEKYPFDSQTCEVRFAMWGYTHYEIGIIAGEPDIDLDEYSTNSVWDLYHTEAKSTIIENLSYFVMIFHMKRKASFTIINLMAPILFLSFLNVMVFLLVPESGERVSYSITVLLAVAVFMTIISSALPPTSDPVPIITYKLMVDMVISALITVITILNLRLYHKDDTYPVPRRLMTIYRFYQFDFCKNHGQRKIGFINDSEDVPENGDVKTDLKKADVNNGVVPGYNPDDTVTWKEISYMADFISFVAFSIAYIVSFVVFLGKMMS